MCVLILLYFCCQCGVAFEMNGSVDQGCERFVVLEEEFFLSYESETWIGV